MACPATRQPSSWRRWRALLVSASAGLEVRADRAHGLRTGAHWLASVESPIDDGQNDELVHRWWIVAAALAQASVALDDAELGQEAVRRAAQAVSLHRPDGVVPEQGGHDVRYHAMAVLFSSRYLLAMGPGAPTTHAEAVAASLVWLVPRIGADGVVDLSGSTRTGERTPNGHLKLFDQARTVEALVLGHHACGVPGALDAAHTMLANTAVATALVPDAPERAERPRSLSIVFVCQGGALEPQALLLATSLRQHVARGHELVAAVPGPAEVWDPPAAETLEALRSLGVRIEPIAPPLGLEFPHANKISCLAIATDADVRVFLDSDIVCLGPLGDRPEFGGAVAAKPADVLAYTRDPQVWEATYRAAGESVPAWRVRTTTSGDTSPPFYNSGVVVADAALGPDLAREWLDCCDRIRRDTSLPDIVAWSDQPGLAVALARLGLTPTALDPGLNLPLHQRSLATAPGSTFAHYHWPSVLREEPMLRSMVQRLAADLPAFRRAAVRVPGWEELLDGARHPMPSPEPPHDLLITGISRSGTSLLCNLLHRYSSCVVINEPDQIHAPLDEPVPWGLSTYLRRLRADVLDGRPVTNKLRDGEVTQDTAVHQELSSYTPRVDAADFVLGTKNTLAYLHHLARIRLVLPHARVALCVRNPLDTIASWKTSFPHLRDVDLSVRPHAHANDRWLPQAMQDRLAEIVAIESPAWRRAHHWAFLAEVAASHLGYVDLVRYDELVSNPSGTAEAILRGWPAGRVDHPLVPMRVRGHRSALDDEDVRAVRAVCGPAAGLLGLDVG